MPARLAAHVGSTTDDVFRDSEADHTHGTPQPGRPTLIGAGTGNGRRGASTGSQLLFGLNQIRGDLASWKPHDEVVAETEQLVVPFLIPLDERQRCQVFVLLTQEGSHEACVNRYLRVGHSLKVHCCANVIMAARLQAASL